MKTILANFPEISIIGVGITAVGNRSLEEPSIIPDQFRKRIGLLFRFCGRDDWLVGSLCRTRF
jgi:hypothetical protein